MTNPGGSEGDGKGRKLRNSSTYFSNLPKKQNSMNSSKNIRDYTGRVFNPQRPYWKNMA